MKNRNSTAVFHVFDDYGQWVGMGTREAAEKRGFHIDGLVHWCPRELLVDGWRGRYLRSLYPDIRSPGNGSNPTCVSDELGRAASHRGRRSACSAPAPVAGRSTYRALIAVKPTTNSGAAVLLAYIAEFRGRRVWSRVRRRQQQRPAFLFRAAQRRRGTGHHGAVMTDLRAINGKDDKPPATAHLT